MKILLIFILGIITMSSNASTILSTSSLDLLMMACRAADEHTLVIFDIDDVL